MIIDAKDLILGRLSTIVAKRALLGDKIDIVNCEMAVISGRRKNILDSYKWKRSIGGTAQKGPYIPTKSKKIITIKEIHKNKLEDTGYITVGHICNQTGGE